MARKPVPAAADPVLRRHLLIVAAVALAWRVLAWALMSRTPFFTTPVVDASHFDLWAQALEAGRRFQPGAFFKPPLYPYLLAFLYKLGFGLRGVYALQGLTGPATAMLVTLIARRLLPPRGALAAGLATALLPMLPFFEFQLLAECWTTLLTVAAVWWLLRAVEGTGGLLRGAAFAGAALAVASLGRPNLVPVIVGAAVWLGLVLRRAGRHARGPVVALCVAAAVVILPVTLRNWKESGSPVLISANLGANLVTGNRDRADGVSAIPVGVEWDDLQRQSFAAGHRDPASSSRWLAGVALKWIAAHPGREAELLGRRVLALLTGWEPRNNIGAAWLAGRHGVFTLARWWPGTWLLLPFAIVGLAAARKDRTAALLMTVLGLLALSVLPFFVNARFRLPLLPLLAVFAVIGALALAEALRRPGPRRLALGAVLVASAVAVNVDWLGLGAPRWGAEDAFNEGLIALRGYDGRPVDERRGVAMLEEAVKLDPSFADASERLGGLDLQQAQRHLQQMRRLLAQGDHGQAQAQARLALQLVDQAIDAHRQALAAYPRSLNSLANLGAADLVRGETLAELANAATAAGDTTAAARLRGQAGGDYDQAVGWLDRALALAPDDRAAARNRDYALERKRALAGAAPTPSGR